MQTKNCGDNKWLIDRLKNIAEECALIKSSYSNYRCVCEAFCELPKKLNYLGSGELHIINYVRIRYIMT